MRIDVHDSYVLAMIARQQVKYESAARKWAAIHRILMSDRAASRHPQFGRNRQATPSWNRIPGDVIVWTSQAEFAATILDLQNTCGSKLIA